MLKTIVAALDESACGARALAAAVSLARNEGARLCICALVDLQRIGGNETPTSRTIELQVDAERRAEHTLRDAVATADALGVPADGSVVVGEPIREISAYMLEQDGDALVIGTLPSASGA